MLKGALHIHSTYSDGEFTLAELRDLFVSAGCGFVCMTDHAESFDEPKLRAYIQECESLSDGNFQFVPGLEYECERGIHILGYGATSLIDSKDPQELIVHIENQRAISVIAHPKDGLFPWIENFRILPHGIETWNSKYDGRYAPRPDTFRLLQRLQKRKPEMHAFYGQDLHWKKQFRGLFTVLSCGSLDLLAALAGGDYFGQKGQLQLPSSGKLSDTLQEHFATIQNVFRGVLEISRLGKKATDRLGLTLPGLIKSQLRRIF